MTAVTIIREARADGVRLALSPTGSIKATGDGAAVNRWLAVIRESKAEIIEALAVGDTATASRWLLHFADREPLAVAFTPTTTHAKVLEAYPGALAAEPIEPGRRQPGAPLAGDQEAAILAWLAAIGETDQEAVAEVLTRCRQDENARRYFLGRAGAIVDDDDRRCCNQCVNLRAGVCAIASPGGVVSAIRGYRPVSGILQRCLAFVPAHQYVNSM